LKGLFRSYDLIGDVVVTRIPPSLEGMRQEIGERLLKQNPRARLVLQAHGPTSSESRTRSMRVIAGGGTARTEHHEHDTTYVVDVEKVCFTPRLSHERLRVARQVRPGERVLNMFAGVGSYSLLIARMVGAIVYSLDSNPTAIECMKLGITCNDLVGLVLPILGDARRVFRTLPTMDRIILPLPSLADEVLGLAVELSALGGVIHHYREVRGLRGDCLGSSINDLGELMEEAMVGDYEVLCSRVIRSVGRKRWHVVHDIRLPDRKQL
jgi:tRNA (guanine37-N1)-methyltransferase